MGSSEEGRVEFQDVMLALSEALREGEGYELSAEEVQEVCSGFMGALNLIEEAKQEKPKRKLWRPE